MFYTYRIRHKVTGRSYYGMTNNVKARWKAHRNLNAEHNGCHYMRAAIGAHGADAFDWEVVGRFGTREEAAADECRLLTEAEKAKELLYNLRLPSDPGGLGNRANFAWGKRAPWLDTSPDGRALITDIEFEDAQAAEDEADFGIGVDPTWFDP